MREFMHMIILSKLKKHNNDIKLCAEKLDISQATIYRILKEFAGK
jgi:transcriptional regulator with PAS, ATPase and Fis domain